MWHRNRANKNEIGTFVFSVPSNNFPHAMLLTAFTSTDEKFYTVRAANSTALCSCVGIASNYIIEGKVGLTKTALNGK
jgi:hypothetical protein